MRYRSVCIIVSLIMLITHGWALAQTAEVLDLDSLIKLDKPLDFNEDTLVKMLGDPGNKAMDRSGGIVRLPDVRRKMLNLSASPEFRMTIFGSRFEVNRFHMRSDEASSLLRFNLKFQNRSVEDFTELLSKEYGQRIDPAPRLGAAAPVYRWSSKDFEIFAYRGSDGFNLEFVHSHYLNEVSNDVVVALKAEPIQAKIISLDPILHFESIWRTTQADFEKLFTAASQSSEKTPSFQWLDAGKTRARFSRNLMPHNETRLTLFHNSLPVEEAVVEFVNGRAARATLSLYNRGDSGEMDASKFNELFVQAGKSLGQVMRVAPQNMSAAVSSANKIVSWMWTTPQAVAMLEHNDMQQGVTRTPEFLRLKLAAPEQAGWSMGKLSVGVQRMVLVKNITKTSDGGVYVANVPMVDQGDKGYCVAASCQRLFEYMQIPCDQHEIAQLVQVDAEKGVNVFGMQKSLTKIDGKYNVDFKPHINPEQFYSSYNKRRISQRQFSVIVKEHVDKGVPLLWVLELGRAQETPPLPNGGQMAGGHMRMIIGYNTAKKQILFTDSWGAGHELKSMMEPEAYDVTIGLYSMSPRGL